MQIGLGKDLVQHLARTSIFWGRRAPRWREARAVKRSFVRRSGSQNRSFLHFQQPALGNECVPVCVGLERGHE